MIRGTTPTHYFNLPFEASLVDKARVIYHQWGKEILRKETEDFKMEGNTISVSLTQEETFLFDCTPVILQLRVRTTSGEVMNTKMITVSSEDCLDCEVL